MRTISLEQAPVTGEEGYWQLVREGKYYPQFAELPDLLLAERTHGFVSWLA